MKMGGRKKLKLTFITNANARKSTFSKRVKSLLKKLDELTTLCDVEGCAVVYGPHGPEPIVGPNPVKAQQVITRFRSLPVLDRTRKMFNQEDYLKECIAKVKLQIERAKADNREAEMMLALNDILMGRRPVASLTISDTDEIRRLIERSITELDRKCQDLGIEPEGPGQAAVAAGMATGGGDEGHKFNGLPWMGLAKGASG